jgi:hypothetical protein
VPQAEADSATDTRPMIRVIFRRNARTKLTHYCRESPRMEQAISANGTEANLRVGGFTAPFVEPNGRPSVRRSAQPAFHQWAFTIARQRLVHFELPIPFMGPSSHSSYTGCTYPSPQCAARVHSGVQPAYLPEFTPSSQAVVLTQGPQPVGPVQLGSTRHVAEQPSPGV